MTFFTWPAVWRLVDVPGQAGADRGVPAGLAPGVGAAGAGQAGGGGRRRPGGLRRDGDAPVEGVAGVAGRAGADGLVLPHLADGADAAHVNAGVLALLPDAGLAGGAVLRDNALGPALVGLAVEARLAAAHHPGADHLADGVGAAGVGVARSRWFVS